MYGGCLSSKSKFCIDNYENIYLLKMLVSKENRFSLQTSESVLSKRWHVNHLSNTKYELEIARQGKSNEKAKSSGE